MLRLLSRTAAPAVNGAGPSPGDGGTGAERGSNVQLGWLDELRHPWAGEAAALPGTTASGLETGAAGIHCIFPPFSFFLLTWMGINP